MWHSRTRIFLTATVFVMTTTTSIASVCLTTAPGYDNGGAEYFELYTGDPLKSRNNMSVRRIAQDPDTAKGVERFSKKLRGRWSGTVTETICKGDQHALREVTIHEKVAARIDDRFSGALAIEAERSNRRRTKLEGLELTPRKRLRHVHVNGRVAFSLVELNSEHNFSFEEKSRVEGPTGARLVHQIRDVEVIGDQLRVEREIYINGFFAAHEEWLLERKGNKGFN